MLAQGPGNWIPEGASENIALGTNNAIFFGNLNSEVVPEMPVRGSGSSNSEVASDSELLIEFILNCYLNLC